jgi:hypothetical protein
MEEIFQLIDKSNKYFKTADHLTYVTYPLIKDVKLLINIIENLYQAMVYGMNAILEYDKLFKRISQFPEDFETKIDIFKTSCAKRYNINREYIVMIEDLKSILDHRNKSPVEFIRRDKFVICNGSFKMKTLNYNKVKDFVNNVKPFIIKINKILRKDDRRC